jgi:hypothetical protein
MTPLHTLQHAIAEIQDTDMKWALLEGLLLLDCSFPG